MRGDGTASTFFHMVDSLVEGLFLLDLESKGIWTVSPGTWLFGS